MFRLKMMAVIVAMMLMAELVDASNDMNQDNLLMLRREQDGLVAATTRVWTCFQVQMEMARYAYTVMDCLEQNGNLWFRIDANLSWEHAWLACHTIQGSNLASVHGIGDYNAVRSLSWFDNAENVGNWLGLNDILEEAQFRWSDGTRVDYLKWLRSAAEPDLTPVQNCVCHLVVSINVSNTFYCADGFADADCSSRKMPICSLVQQPKY